jgi:hypothetical protein
MSNRTRPRPVKSGSRPVAAASSPVRRIVPVVVAVVIAFALGALLAGPIGAADDDASTFDDRVAALRAEDAKRDAAQIVELTDKARRIREQLLPVLTGLATAAPPGQPPGPAANTSDVDGWSTATGKAVEEFAEPPSGGTGVNIARSGLAAAVRSLDAAVDTYAAALALPADARGVLLELTGRQRDIAVSTWSTAATQLDLLNVDAGNGHTHVFLPAVPGQGALTPDGTPEGK